MGGPGRQEWRKTGGGEGGGDGKTIAGQGAKVLGVEDNGRGIRREGRSVMGWVGEEEDRRGH